MLVPDQRLDSIVAGITALSDNLQMMPLGHLRIVLRELISILIRYTPGSIVEMGCAGCHTSLRLAAVLQIFDQATRPLHLYDTFDRFPEPTTEDQQRPDWRERECKYLSFPPEGPIRLFEKSGDGLPVPVVHFGLFSEESDPANPHPDPIAFALLDCDLYASTQTALRIVWPRTSPGGVVLIHDHGNPMWPGVEQACREWFADKSHEFESRTVETLLIVIKR